MQPEHGPDVERPIEIEPLLQAAQLSHVRAEAALVDRARFTFPLEARGKGDVAPAHLPTKGVSHGSMHESVGVY